MIRGQTNKWDNIIEARHRNFLHSLAIKLKIFFATKYKHINLLNAVNYKAIWPVKPDQQVQHTIKKN